MSLLPLRLSYNPDVVDERPHDPRPYDSRNAWDYKDRRRGGHVYDHRSGGGWDYDHRRDYDRDWERGRDRRHGGNYDSRCYDDRERGMFQGEEPVTNWTL